MKAKNTVYMVFTLICFAVITNCGSLGFDLDGNDSTASFSDTDDEVMVTEAINDLASIASSSASSASSSSSLSSLVKGPAYLTVDSETGSTASNLRKFRFRCEDITAVTESFSCDNSDGSVTRDVWFEDCALENPHRADILNGQFTNTIANGGEGLCQSFDRINFGNMVMGRDEVNAVHTHTIGEEGMVFTRNDTSDDVYTTVTGYRQTTFTNPVDEDEDGAAETVTENITKEMNHVTTVNGEDKIDITIHTLNESMVPVDADGSALEEVVFTPLVHDLVLLDNGRIDSRTHISGQIVVDRNNANLRMVISVGEEGLSFYGVDDDSCGPETGTMYIKGYELNDDDNYEQIATGEVVYEDGVVQSASYNGVDLNLKPRTCE